VAKDEKRKCPMDTDSIMTKEVRKVAKGKTLNHQSKKSRHVNLQGPQVVVFANPVCVNVQAFRLVLAHNELGRLPDSAVLFDRVKFCSEEGNAGGSGGGRLWSCK